MEDQDRPLPTSFWGNPTAATDNPEPVRRTAHEEQDIANQWAPTFKVLGYEFHDAMGNCLNTYSALLEKQMLTVEDVYRHLKAQQALVDAGDLVSPNLTPGGPRSTPAHKTDKALRVAEASAAWHMAVQQRKEAIANWDTYVKTKKAEYAAAKAS